MAEHLIVTPTCRILRIYTGNRKVKADSVVAAVESLDSMVAKSLFNRDNLVGALQAVLREVEGAAETRFDDGVAASASKMRKVLDEYRSRPLKPIAHDWVE